MIKQIFWNHNEHRLRSFWRLILQLAFFLILLIPTSIVAVLIGLLIVQAQGSMTAETFFSGLSDQSIGMPIMGVLFALATLVAMLGSIGLAGYFIDRRQLASFGIRLSRDWWIDLAFGLVLGAALMALIFIVELLAGWIQITDTFVAPPGDSFFLSLLNVLILFVCVGIYEEFLSRGYHLKNMCEGFHFLGERGSVALSILFSSAIFGMAHLVNPNADFVSTFNIFLAGIFLALGMVLTGNLAIPIGLHITWNFFQGNIFGFPVSGNNVGTSLIAIEQGGNPVITGGPFGPEAGVIGVLAIMLGCLFVVGWVKWRYGRISIYPHLTTPTLRPRKTESDDN